ncbi:Helix-turn-helix [Alicyclobacillus macrosporangiidus]|uniref:Helix-turn-helix n=1 Tax=Alicyclobacillus macrosporangiidus TaxID=392015 RepID=A0A1I7IBJ6_9BACL|nr:Helix-turn-helix [Alicyclobacillus macrosporangiidus]
MSKESGVAASAINKIESGDMRPTVDVLSRLCSALGITLSEFFAEDRSDELPPDLRRLISIAKELTPQQREQLAKFLETMKGGDD